MSKKSVKTDKTENTNCLSGLRCPKCGSLGPFGVAAWAWFIIHDDGTDEYDNVEWDDDSAIKCQDCSTMGQVRDFAIHR